MSEEDVKFRSHIDGRLLNLTPEESIRIQRYLGADIIMAFDECPDLGSLEQLRGSIERTIRWLQRSVDAWRDTQKGWPGVSKAKPSSALYRVGSTVAWEYSAEHTLAFDLPGYAVGGLSVAKARRTATKSWTDLSAFTSGSPPLPHGRRHPARHRRSSLP